MLQVIVNNLRTVLYEFVTSPESRNALHMILTSISSIIFISMFSVLLGMLIVVYKIVTEHGFNHVNGLWKKKHYRNTTAVAECTMEEPTESLPKGPNPYTSEHSHERAQPRAESESSDEVPVKSRKTKCVEEETARSIVELINDLIITNKTYRSVLCILMVNLVLYASLMTMDGVIRTFSFVSTLVKDEVAANAAMIMPQAEGEDLTM